MTTMQPTEKYKIWDIQEKKWYLPEYPGTKMDHKKGKAYESNITRELMFSQGGEMFIHESDGVSSKLIHIAEESQRYIPCLYTGVKDINDKKVYVSDTIKAGNTEGIVLFMFGMFCVRWKDPSMAPEPLFMNLEGRLRRFEVVGNILEHKAKLEAAADQSS